MNVAEHIRSAWAVESHFLLRSCLIKSEVKSLPAVKRKHTVKPWIEIREIDNAPRGYNQQVGFERLSALHHTIVRSILVEAYRANRVQRNEPNHYPGTVHYSPLRAHLNQPDLTLDRLGRLASKVVCLCRRRDEEDQKRRKDSTWTRLHSHPENKPHCHADLTSNRRSSRDRVGSDAPALSRTQKLRAWPADVVCRPH